MALYDAKGNKIILPGTSYNCQEYGVLPSNSDNTSAMQALIDKIHEKGGGVIWMPVGEYRFDGKNGSIALSSNVQACLTAKSGVSIMGESITGTIVKVYGDTTNGAAWIASLDTNVTVGCVYQNFTVDMSEESMTNYTHKGKAFYLSGVKDCVFRDLRLLNTPSTSLGIDMLDNVVIDSVYVYNGGRQWSFGGNGGAGIGIGTGKWENENYIIRNCICDSCGHFGIFLEDQGIFSGTGTQNYPKGQIIANNIVRNGRNYGIGVRGGKNIIITGNNIYENYGGIYMDYGAKNVMVSNNVVQGNAEAGFLFGDEDATVNKAGYACENVMLSGNGFYENLFGTWTITEPQNSQNANNLFAGNVAETPVATNIDSSLIVEGAYINDSGVKTTLAGNWLYDIFIDLTTTRFLYTQGATNQDIRVAEYDENQAFIKRWYGNYPASTIPLRVGENCRYIKIGDNCSGAVLSTLKLYGAG
ncbi:MAG: right-handed parallel beta-helix repeat-containing protein [Oscillospiraceae bacterium]|nr:right-handed parallel beta-helix repeat-containing protein [Oscillospiraceae bacterium]